MIEYSQELDAIPSPTPRMVALQCATSIYSAKIIGPYPIADAARPPEDLSVNAVLVMANKFVRWLEQ